MAVAIGNRRLDIEDTQRSLKRLQELLEAGERVLADAQRDLWAKVGTAGLSDLFSEDVRAKDVLRKLGSIVSAVSGAEDVSEAAHRLRESEHYVEGTRDQIEEMQARVERLSEELSEMTTEYQERCSDFRPE